MYCPKCKTYNDSSNSFCEYCGLILSKALKSVSKDNILCPTEILIDEYAVSTDAMVGRAVSDLPVFSQAAKLLLEYWNIPIHRTNLLGNSVKLGPYQIPSVYRIVEELSTRMSIKVPDTYIKYDPAFNAMTLGTSDDHIMIIHSALVDNFTEEELKFVIGHELGHIKSNHVTNNTIAYLINNSMGAFSAALFRPLTISIEVWQRRAEFTADRAGVISCQNPIAAIQALTMFALGSRKLMEEFSIQDFIQQSNEISRNYDIINKVVSSISHPYTAVRVKELIEFCKSQMGQTLLTRMGGYRDNNRENLISSNLSLFEDKYDSSSQKVFCSTCGYKAAAKDRECRFCGETLE